MELVDAKFSLVLRRRDRTPGTVSEFLNTFDLPLVRPEEAYLKYGFLLRHVIDEKSPLHEQSDYQVPSGQCIPSLLVVGKEHFDYARKAELPTIVDDEGSFANWTCRVCWMRMLLSLWLCQQPKDHQCNPYSVSGCILCTIRRFYGIENLRINGLATRLGVKF